MEREESFRWQLLEKEKPNFWSEIITRENQKKQNQKTPKLASWFSLGALQVPWAHQPWHMPAQAFQNMETRGSALWQTWSHMSARRVSVAKNPLKPNMNLHRNPATRWRISSLHGDLHAFFFCSPEADCPLPGRWGEPDGFCRAGWRALDARCCAGSMGAAVTRFRVRTCPLFFSLYPHTLFEKIE